MIHPGKQYGDLASGAVLAALGVFIIVSAWQWEYLGPDGPGAGFFPLWYGIAMVALACGLVVTSLAARAGRDESRSIDVRGMARAGVTWGALVVAVGLVKIIGFALSLALLTFFIVAGMYQRSVGTGFLVAIANAAAFYLLFVVALDINLPAGPFGF